MQEENQAELKDFFEKINYYLNILWANKFLLVLFGLIGGGISGYLAYRKPVTYSAPLTFMINDDGSSAGGGLSVLIGQFGLGGGGDKFNAEKVLEISKSRKIAYPILFDSIIVQGEKNLVANHLMRTEGYREDWGEKFNDFSFTSDQLSEFSKLERVAIQKIHANITSVNNSALELLYPGSTGIYYMTVKLKNEELAKELCNLFYNAIASFYVQQSIEQQKQTYRLIKITTDSIQRELFTKESQLATIKDRSRSLYSAKSTLREARLMREIQGLALMYAETMKNQETSRFILQNATPVFQIIDRPYLPLEVVRDSTVKAIAIGGLLSVFVVGFIAIFRRVYVDTMGDDSVPEVIEG